MIETLGSRLKRLRKSRHLNQKQVAELIDVTRSSICCYENDSRQPSLDVLLKLAELYHASTDYLLGNQHQTVLDMSGLSEDEQVLILNLVNSMSDKNAILKR